MPLHQGVGLGAYLGSYLRRYLGHARLVKRAHP
jgi:hypothetical protein